MNSPTLTTPDLDIYTPDIATLRESQAYINAALNDALASAQSGLLRPEVTDDNVEQLLGLAYINPTEELQAPAVCLEVKQETGPAIICTLGNFSLIIGKAKSRKTFFITIALAAAVRNDGVLNTFCGSLPSDQARVLYFDTEQGKYHVQKAVKRVLTLSETQQPENFRAYGLRRFSPADRLRLIEHAIQHTPNLGFVVIDGIRDLVSSINDEELATMMASRLLKWSEEYKIHILCVLHQNKGDNNARGHLGTELQNKAESVLSITKSSEDKEISIVEAEYCREKEFEPFAFSIDENGLPYIVDEWCNAKLSSHKCQAPTPGSLELQQHQEILQRVFLLDSKPSYRDLTLQIKEYLKVGDNKAKDFISWYKANELITLVGKAGTKACFYQLTKPV